MACCWPQLRCVLPLPYGVQSGQPGSSRRGLAFEGAIKHKMGTVDADDQAAGLQFLFAGTGRPTRIGIYGVELRGYLAAICLARCPALFNCAVAGAPVTSWDGYYTALHGALHGVLAGAQGGV